MKWPRRTFACDFPLRTPAVSCTTEQYIRALDNITLSRSVGDGSPMRSGFPKSHPFAIDTGEAFFFFKYIWHSSHSSNEAVEPSCNRDNMCLLVSNDLSQTLSLSFLHI